MMFTSSQSQDLLSCIIIMYSPNIISLSLYINPFVLKAICPRSLLILRAHEVSVASFMKVRTRIQQKLYHCWVLIYYCHMEYTFTLEILFIAFSAAVSVIVHKMNIYYKIRTRKNTLTTIPVDLLLKSIKTVN